jgi:Cu2+-exporting ATPase
MLVRDFCTGIRIAAPTAVLSAMHRAGRRGILIKSGAALEKLASVTAIVFDKTGTLTSGEPVVEQVTQFNGNNEDQVLALAASVEMRLHHPAARAIVKAAQQKGLTILEQDESKFSRGMGVKAMVGGNEVIVGSKSMMEVEGIEIDSARDSEMQATRLGESVAYVAIDRKVAGLIRYKDRLRPEVADAMTELKKMGINKLIMATGDTKEAAERIARVCGIDDVMARAFPEDKQALVQKLKAEGHIVAVIGDGINDSPALAYADVAISLHGATDAARQCADRVLTDDNLQRLPEAIRIARSSISLVKQNLVMAVVPNSAGFALAAAGLLGPAGATILNNGAAMGAAINGLRPLYSSNWSKAEPIEPPQAAE